jgi:hypothetical protein
VTQLAAALETLRANLAVVIAELNAGDRAKALAALRRSERQLRKSMRELVS